MNLIYTRIATFLFLTLWLVGTGFGQLYSGAELRTLESFTYGRFEASIKSAQGEGFLSSFFTYNDDYPSNDWCEIDMEILGRWGDNIDVNIIDENGSHLRQHPVDFNPHVEFHTYGFEWTPDYVAWFIDDEEFYRQEGEHVPHLAESAKLMMNMWTPAYTDWVGFIDNRTLPRFAYYDWAAYASYTPGTGSVGTDQNFSPVWHDDFDSFDDTHWEKSEGHSWPGNNATMRADNIVYQDGKMILCLTEPGQEGFNDETPPEILWARAHNPDSVIIRFNKELDVEHTNSASVFTISGYPHSAMQLYDDFRTVGLRVEDLDYSAAITLYAQNLKDQSINGNLQSLTFTPVIMPTPLDLPINIDCAGPGAQGFLPDQWWSENVEYGHDGGNYQTNGAYPDLEGTELDSVMATSLNRYSRYHVRLAHGVFDIQLHFAEHFYTAPGERTFQLYVEDSLVVAELDVYAESGNSAIYTLSLEGWEITDGILDIVGAALEYGRTYAYAGPLLNAIQIDGSYYVGIDSELMPSSYGLTQIFPNPFNQSARMEFSIPESTDLTISLFDLRGAEVRTIAADHYSAGNHSVSWDGNGLSSGLYIVRFHTGNFQQNQKVLLLK